MVEELTHRCSGVGEELISGIQACNPTTETFLSEEALKSLAAHFRIQLKPEELLVFPSLKAVFQVALTIPVSSCERSFSAWRRLPTWLRSTMGQRQAQ